MTAPEIWFAIPSASVERCRKVLPVWRERGYKIAVLQNVERGEIPADICVWSDHYPGWAESINILCRDIVPKSAPIVVSGGCDMLPDPNHTAAELGEQFLQHFADSPGGTFGVMQPCGDEFMEAPHFCGSPFLGRAWIDSMYAGKGPMFGGYRHNWADNELFWTARGLGALFMRPDLSHFHQHFNRDGSEQPAWWTRNVKGHDRQDVELFLSRAWLNFPGHEPAGIERRYDPAPFSQDTARLAYRHYMHFYGPGASERDGCTRVTDALARCAAAGLAPVALYGAGAHTKKIVSALASPAEVACIIDDDPARDGGKLWGFPIVGLDEAVRRGVKAIVLSSDAHEESLWDRTKPVRDSGLAVLRLYAPTPREKNRRTREALEGLAKAGRRRVGIYGAGAHTKDATQAIEASPISVVCLIDDDPSRAGTRLAGKPVILSREAAKAELDAVILSSDRFEAKMWEQTREFRRRGIEVLALYDRYSDAA